MHCIVYNPRSPCGVVKVFNNHDELMQVVHKLAMYHKMYITMLGKLYSCYTSGDCFDPTRNYIMIESLADSLAWEWARNWKVSPTRAIAYVQNAFEKKSNRNLLHKFPVLQKARVPNDPVALYRKDIHDWCDVSLDHLTIYHVLLLLKDKKNVTGA